MDKKIIILVILSVLITAIIVGGGVYVLQKVSFEKEKQQLQQQIDDLNNQLISLQNNGPNNNTDCKQLYNEIENDLDKANYCEVDTDCDLIMLGGSYIEFGCSHYVNINTNQKLIFDKMDYYESKCDDMINYCGEALTASCVADKCVESYIACGCGCCGGVEPEQKCLYHSKGDSMQQIINEDMIASESPDCPLVGCSMGYKYIYCD